MGKKGVILDNGKAARSSMSLYWKASEKKNKNPAKKQEREEDIEERAGSNQDKWKSHKQKMISKMYDQLDKSNKKDAGAEEANQKREEQELEKQLYEKQVNKNKPARIPGFKNAAQLQAKMQFQQVHLGKEGHNTLIPRTPAEQLSHEEIIQLLREKKAKKELERAHKERVDRNLQDGKLQEDFMMDGLSIDKKHKAPEQKPEQSQESQKIEPAQQTFFKSNILQKIERGEHLAPKQEPVVAMEKDEAKVPREKVFQPHKFLPRALRRE